MSLRCLALTAVGLAHGFLAPAAAPQSAMLRTSAFTQSTLQMGAKGAARLASLSMKLGDKGEPVRAPADSRSCDS